MRLKIVMERGFLNLKKHGWVSLSLQTPTPDARSLRPAVILYKPPMQALFQSVPYMAVLMQRGMSVTLWRCWRRHRFFLTSCSRLQIDERTHLFDGERLTDIQNNEAIRDAPALDEAIKFYHTIPHPSDVADILTRVYPKDILVTILSRDQTFMGSDHSAQMLNSEHQKSPIKLHFGNLAYAWLKDFNVKGSGSGLKNFDPIMIRLSNSQIEKKIADGLREYLENGSNVLTVEEIDAFVEFIDAYRSNSKPSALLFMQRDQRSITTVGEVVNFLAQYFAQQNTNTFPNLVSYACSPQAALTSADLRQSIEKLLDIIHNLPSEKRNSYVASLAKSLFEEVTSAQLLVRVHSKSLDDFARDLAGSGNGTLARKVLGIMVEQQGVYPSADTMDSFWQVYAESFAGKSKAEAICSLTTLKPVMFHHGASAHNVEVLLRYFVSCTHELERCMYFIEQSKDAKQLLAQFQTRFAEKLLDIHRTTVSTPIERALERTQLARAFAIKNKIPLTEGTRNLLEHGV